MQAPLAAQGAPGDSAATAQRRATIGALLGERVRLEVETFDRRTYRGRVDSVLATTVVLDTITGRPQSVFSRNAPVVLDRFRRVTLSLDDLREVAVSRGTSRLRGALWGALAGGVALGALEGLSSSGLDPAQRGGTSGFVRGAAIGVAVGAPIGALFGRERWQQVSMETR